MKADFTRLTFKPEKHYSSVRMQQGRVQLDADWNEQADIQAYLERTEASPRRLRHRSHGDQAVGSRPNLLQVRTSRGTLRPPMTFSS